MAGIHTTGFGHACDFGTLRAGARQKALAPTSVPIPKTTKTITRVN